VLRVELHLNERRLLRGVPFHHGGELRLAGARVHRQEERRSSGRTERSAIRARDRRISIVIFLNAQAPENVPGGYTGGELVFHAPYPHVDLRQAVVGTAGSLLAFRSETTDEVTMVTGGERSTIATWFHAAHGAHAGGS
jgi:predicted 2-oxoglutarate/Fe(II)-dependent dioxygenase YbiX